MATLRVVGQDDIGIVANMTSLINKEGTAMLRNITINSLDGLFEGYLVISVNSLEQLDELMKKMRTLKGVKEVERTWWIDESGILCQFLWENTHILVVLINNSYICEF